MQGRKLIHLLLHKTSCSRVVNLDSSNLVDEFLYFQVELVLVVGDIVESLHLRVLNQTLQLFQVK